MAQLLGPHLSVSAVMSRFTMRGSFMVPPQLSAPNDRRSIKCCQKGRCPRVFPQTKWRELIKHGLGVCSTQWLVLCRAGLDEMDELCATDKTVRVHAEFDLALERVAGIVVG